MSKSIQRNTGLLTFGSVADMRAFVGGSGLKNGETVYLHDSTNPGNWEWSTSSSATDDGVDVVKITSWSGAGRFLRLKPNAENSRYNQGGTGAVDTTVKEKFQRRLDVKDKGAVGDGVTDDTAAIQAAVLDLASGGVLEFPKGNFIYRSRTSLPSNISIVGAGRSGTTITFGPSPNIDGVGPEAFDADNVDNVTIEGIKFVRGGALSVQNGSTNITVINCELDGKYVDTGAVTRAGGSLVDVDDSVDGLSIINCRSIDSHEHVKIGQNQTAGASVYSGNIVVRGCWFENTVTKFSADLTDPAPVGVYNYSAGDISVIDCDFKNIRDDASIGVDGQSYAIYSGDAVSVNYSRKLMFVQGCRFYDDDTVGTGNIPMQAISCRIEKHLHVADCFAQYESSNKGRFLFVFTELNKPSDRSITVTNCKTINATASIINSGDLNADGNNTNFGSVTLKDIENITPGDWAIGNSTNIINVCHVDNFVTRKSDKSAIRLRGKFESLMLRNSVCYDGNQDNSTTAGERGGFYVQGLADQGTAIIQNNWTINTIRGGGHSKHCIEDVWGATLNRTIMSDNQGVLLEDDLYKTGPTTSGSNFGSNIPLADGQLLLDPAPPTSGNTGTLCDFSYMGTLSGAESTGQTVLSVTSSSGFITTTNQCAVELDDGTLHITSITAKATGPDTVTVNDALPSDAASGNRVWQWRTVGF